MSKNKQALKRYTIILRKLRRPGKHSSKDIHQSCLNSGIEVAYRTIQKDLENLRDDHSIFGVDLRIREDKSEKKWYSEGLPKEIFKSIELEDDEIEALLFYAKTVNQYIEYPFFDKISDAVKKVIDVSNIPTERRSLFDTERYLQTEKHYRVDGIELIAQVLNCIENKILLKIDYLKFEGADIKTYKIKPLLIKEDKHFWYLIGECIEKKGLRTLALDRIISLEETDITFEEVQFDPSSYFYYSFGITVTEDEPIETLIKFDHHQANYIKALPIHSTQNIIEESDHGILVKYEIKPSYEFYSKILSYGASATIISPDSVREEIILITQSALNNYSSDS